jgi:hypothetical protein
MTVRRGAVPFLFAWFTLCFSLSLHAGIQTRVDHETLLAFDAPTEIGGHLVVKNVDLGLGARQTLELERFDVFAPDAVIEVYDAAGKPHPLKPTAVRQFRGQIAGQPDSLVYLSVGDEISGLIIARDHKFVARSMKVSNTRQRELLIDEVAMTDELEMPGYTCDIDNVAITPTVGFVPRSLAFDAPPQADGALVTLTSTTTLNLALQTDVPLYTNFGSNAATLETWVRNTYGAASTIYRRDLRTDLRIVYLGISTATDPWVVNPGTAGTWNGNAVTYTSGHALAEYGDYWHNSAPTATPRSAAMLLSGQSQLAGVGWIGTVCQADFLCGSCGSADYTGHYGGAYAYCGGLGLSAGDRTTIPDVATPPYNVPASYYWAVLQISHELGHVVQSQHTHCIALTAQEQSTYSVARGFVDICNSPGGSCYSGVTSVPVEKGTIMSYCHLLAGGGTNLRWIFGEAGFPSAKVLSNMRTALDAKTPNLSAIGLSATTLAAGATGTASVTSLGGGYTYLWSISNGSINSGQGTNSIGFTASTNPTTITLTVTLNSTGCAVTDSATVTVTAGASAVKGDFTGDGKPDVLLRNYSTGQDALWPMNGTTWTGTIIDLPALPLTTYRFEGTGDFNADGKNDVLLRNGTTGQNALWLMNGTTLNGIVDLPALPNTAYKFEGTGDFNADGKPDIILRNTTTGQDALWLMNGTALQSIVDLPALANVAYRFESCGDFNADGKPDIVLRNYTTGQNAIWLMNGTVLQSIVDLPALPNTSYRIDAVADFNNDTKPDIVLRNYSTGQNAIWIMNGTSLSSVVDLPALPNVSYEINGPR